ncbi:hypothetical protein PSEUDT2_00886 [Stutzerimonas stutzeri]|nr:hypothetical protein PSEUDT2_00886 [Stutzerimonas stutzeri]
MSGLSPALPCSSVGASAAHEPDGHSWRTVLTEPVRRYLGRKTVGFLPECRRSALSSARATGCASHGALLFFARAKKSKQKKARPCIRPCATRRVRSLHRRSRGRLTRTIHGPLSLSPHPCGSSPYATIPLTLLKGDRVLPASPRMDKRTPVRRDVGWKSAQQFPPQATSTLSPSHGVLLFQPVGKLRVTHPTDPFRNFQPARTTAPGVTPEGGEFCAANRGRPVRMSASPSLWLLSLGETRESDAPCKAQPAVPAEESAAPDNIAYAAIDHPAISIPPCPNRQRHALRINPEAPTLPPRGDHP